MDRWAKDFTSTARHPCRLAQAQARRPAPTSCGQRGVSHARVPLRPVLLSDTLPASPTPFRPCPRAPFPTPLFLAFSLACMCAP